MYSAIKPPPINIGIVKNITIAPRKGKPFLSNTYATEYCKNKLNNEPEITRSNEIIALRPMLGSFKTMS